MKIKKIGILVIIIFTGISLTRCNNNKQQENNQQQQAAKNVNVPAFNADSAYAYVAKQISFGPRISNTPAHEACKQWLIAKMKSFADTVYLQHATVDAPQNPNLPFTNIIGSFNPQAKTRILLLAHWDTRPQSDQDSNPANRNKPFDGADDGGSGVAVCLEIARELHQQNPGIGVDILLVDAEDSGVEGQDNTYALGTQYWAKHPHVPNYHANYGVLLDMVGGKNAQFYMEAFSKKYAFSQMKMIWDTGNKLGYSDYFRYEPLDATITDDHVAVNQIANIPTLDMIDLRQPGGSFPPWWHTQQDNMSVIDKHTLKAVGQTLLQVLYTNPPY